MIFLQLDLFGEAPAPESVLVAHAERRHAARSASGWVLVDHACRKCMGRVLVRMQRGQAVVSRCAECGERAEGAHSAICCCGAEAGSAGRVLECFRNLKVSAAVPQEVLVRERAIDAIARAMRTSKPVGDTGY